MGSCPPRDRAAGATRSEKTSVLQEIDELLGGDDRREELIDARERRWVEGVRLSDGHEGGRSAQDLPQIQLLPMGGELGNRIGVRRRELGDDVVGVAWPRRATMYP